MSDITVRHIDFSFDGDIPFHWNPGNPQWGNFVNLITMIVPAFEKYVIRSTRAAIPRLGNTRLKRDADLFCRQEAQHSKHHIQHIKVLTGQYPGLQEVAEQVMASYDQLFESESLEFHLAYAAMAELYLGPMASFVTENRQALMGQGDSRIASFILWHFIEEFEHRNAALDICNDVVGSFRFRVKCFPKIARHLNHVKSIVLAGFDEHVPQPANGPKNSAIGDMFASAPTGKTLRLYYELLCTLLPYHRPDTIREPDWVRQWHRDYWAGVDMTRYFPAAS